MKHLSPMEAWQRVSATSTKRRAKGSPPMPEVTTIGQSIYIFAQDESATVTSANDDLPPILAQWEQGEGVMPDALTEMLSSYANQVKWWEDEGSTIQSDSSSTSSGSAAAKSKAKAKSSTSTSRQSITPLVKCKWGQWSPFNDNIRLGDKKVECPVGCTAMATAQILYFWGCQSHNGKYYHRGCIATKAYKTDTLKYKVAALPPVTVFDYKHMTANRPSTKAGKKAVAQLLEYIGKACKADYTAKSTGAYLSKGYYFLRDYTRLCQKMGYIYEQTLGAASFEEKVYQSLVNGCPVIVSGKSDKNGAHVFIVDGYDASRNLYHINWGWYGQYDGWFALNALTPGTSDNYSSYKAAITNIKPDGILGDMNGDGEITVQDATEVIKEALIGGNNPKADIDSNGEVTVNDAQKIADHITGKETL